MKNQKNPLRISVRNTTVRDMILTRKGGPHITLQKDDWWDDDEELESWDDEEDA